MFQALVRGNGITLQKIPNWDEFITTNNGRFPFFCDEIKPTFLSLIRHFFQEIGWSKALPHTFG
jgi:hypothetical protein